MWLYGAADGIVRWPSINGDLLAREWRQHQRTQQKSRTALLWASIGGQEAIIRLLLENSVDVTAQDKKCRMALHWALVYGYKRVVKLHSAAAGIQSLGFDFHMNTRNAV